MVGNNALPQRVHGNHVAGGPVQHVPGGRAYLKNLAGVPVHGNHAGLPDDQTLSVGIDQHIGGSQVHAQVIGKQ